MHTFPADQQYISAGRLGTPDSSFHIPVNNMASTSNSPPPPNTNRRVFHDVSVIANIPPDDPKLKSFRIALIAAETWKRKDLMSGGAVIGPEGIEVFARGKKALELDEIDPGVVKKEMKVWVEKNLDEEKKKAVEEAGILKPAMASGKKAVLVVGKGNEGIAKSRGKSSASNEPSMKKKDKKSSDNAKNDVENDVENHGEKQQLHKEEESIEINWDEDITYTWNCDEIRRKIKTCLFPALPPRYTSPFPGPVPGDSLTN
ncbi:hypothetical protein BGX38DRAFT_1226832, partial [Terfezia claveryi]